MSNRTAGIIGTIVLAIFLAAFTSSALAGNGNGKANGNSDATTAAPGNSGNAPGHNKSTDTTSSTQSATQGSASQNSPTTPGMKPTNSTSKNTTCTTGGGGGSAATCAPSSSDTAAVTVGTKDASKRYGNGHTAAQIATSNGAPAGTPIFGPGNSQPHKVKACPGTGKAHLVDVHAVKHFGSTTCSTSSQTQTQVMTSQNGTTTVTGPATVTAATGAKTQGKGLALGKTGGVLGVTAAVSNSGNAAPAGGVLGALTTVGQGTLPFTGFPLWAAVALALMLIVLGLGLQRTARARV